MLLSTNVELIYSAALVSHDHVIIQLIRGRGATS